MPDVVVVGGGVIGTAVAWDLARHGLSVDLLEPGPLGGQSSKAAAGILGPLAESAEDGPFTRLMWESLMRFPDWLDALAEDTDIDPEWDRGGILRLVAPDEIPQQKASLSWRQSYDKAVLWQEPGDFDDDFGTQWAGAIWSPHEAQIYGPRYLAALGQAASQRSVNIRLGTLVTGLIVNKGRMGGVRTAQGDVLANTVVMAAGAWTAPLLDPQGFHLDAFPIRGQVLGVRAPRRPFDYVLFGPDGYLVPKRDGLIVVGATEDAVAFDARVSMQGVWALANKLAHLGPQLLSLPFDRAWAGLRPKTADGLPYLGTWPNIDGLIIATGHYRNGLLLSPITADIVTALVLQAHPPEALAMATFDPARHARRPDNPGGLARPVPG